MTPPSETKRRTDWTVLRWLTGLTVLGLVAWAPRSPLLFFALCAGTPVEMHEADLNHDGYVSVIEAGYACNVDSRPVTHDGRACIEYYSRADWRPIKEVCEEPERAADIQRLWNRDADLTEVRAGLLVAEGIGELHQREALVDHRLQAVGLASPHQVQLMAAAANGDAVDARLLDH